MKMIIKNQYRLIKTKNGIYYIEKLVRRANNLKSIWEKVNDGYVNKMSALVDLEYFKNDEVFEVINIIK